MPTASRADRSFHFAAAVARGTNLFAMVLTKTISNMTPLRLICLRRRYNEADNLSAVVGVCVEIGHAPTGGEVTKVSFIHLSRGNKLLSVGAYFSPHR